MQLCVIMRHNICLEQPDEFSLDPVRWKQVKNSEPCRGKKFLPLPTCRVLHRDRRGGVVSEVRGFQSAAVVP